MKLVSYSYHGKEGYGVVTDDKIIDLAAIAGEVGVSLRESLERNALARIAAWSAGAHAGLPLREVDFLPVIPNPQKILCVGINYLSHMKETGREVPKYPMIFTRFADSQAGHLQALIRPAVSDKLDFEGELAIVIGKPAHERRSRAGLRRRVLLLQRWEYPGLAAPYHPVHSGQEFSADRRLRSVAGDGG